MLRMTQKVLSCLAVALFCCAPVHAATTVTHQYDIGDGADAGSNGGAATSLADNVGSIDLTRSGTNSVYTDAVAVAAANNVGSTLAVNVDAATGFFASGVLTASSNYGYDLWIKPDIASQNGNIFFPNGWEYGSGGGKGGLGVIQTGTGIRLIAPNISNIGVLAAANTSQWTHVAVTLTGTSTVRGYVNGELVLMSNTNPSEAGGALHMAVNSGGGTGWDGQLDHARVFTFTGQFNPDDLALATTNLGLGGTATQSSTLSNAANPIAAKAIDNNIDGVFNNGSVTHTNTETNPWWQVAMTDYGRIDTVVLNNRADCCGDRLSDIFLDVFNSDGDVVWTSAVQNPGNTLGSPAKLTIDVPDYVQGKTVRVRRVTASGVLSLAEAQVLGERLVNHAAGKPTTQSSTLSGTYSADKAVNGNPDDFTHTSSSDTSPYWEVDLGGGTATGSIIETIFIHNRESCCGGRLRDLTVQIYDLSHTLVFDSFDVLGDFLNPGNILGGGLTDFGTGPAFLELDLRELLGHNVVGRYVRILRTPDSAHGGSTDDQRVLALGEVEVLGVVPTPAALPAGLGLLAGLGLRRRRRA